MMLLKDKNPQFYENLCQLYPKYKEQLDNLNAPEFEAGQKAILTYHQEETPGLQDGDAFAKMKVLIIGCTLDRDFMSEKFFWDYAYISWEENKDCLCMDFDSECHLELNYMCLETGVVDESN